MFGFIKKPFFVGLAILSSENLLNTIPLNATPLSPTPLKYVSMTNQECKVRPKIVNVNSDEPILYPFSIKTSKCSGSCNKIKDPCAKMCVPNVIKNINVKVFNLMSKTIETRHINRHGRCKCEWRVDDSVCNNKQRRNDDKCRCEWKELIGKGWRCKGYIWNPSNCKCEYDKSCDVGKCLDYDNCKCRKKLVDQLTEHSSTEECTESIDEVKIAQMALFEYGDECVRSYTICVILAVIALTISIEIGAYFACSRWYLKKDVTCVKLIARTQWKRSNNNLRKL